METIQKLGEPAADLPKAMSSVKIGSWRSEMQDRAFARDAGPVMKPAGKVNSMTSQSIVAQSAEVAGLKRRMAKLFPELVRSQQQGTWSVSRAQLAGDSAASE